MQTYATIVILVMSLTRFLLSSIYGFLLLSLALYFSASSIFDIDVYGITELLDWYILQSEQTKNTILGSFITIIGFLIAYATATSTWKSQLQENLKQSLVSEINTMFIECSNLSTDCKLYAEQLIKAHDSVSNDMNNDNDNKFLISRTYEKAQKFINNKERLIQNSIDVYDISRRYGLLLLSLPHVYGFLNNAIDSLDEIVNKIYINVPKPYDDKFFDKETFLMQIDKDECQSLIDSVSKNHVLMNIELGKINGVLNAKLINQGFHFIYNFIKMNKIDKKNS